MDADFSPSTWRRALTHFEHCFELEQSPQLEYLFQLQKDDPEAAAAVRRLLAQHAKSDPAQSFRLDVGTMVERYSTPRKAGFQARTVKRWIVLAAAAIGLFYLLFTLTLISEYKNNFLWLGWQGAWTGIDVRVTGVNLNGPAAGKLTPGDRIVSYSEPSVQRAFPFFYALQTIPTGSKYLVYAVRNNVVLRLALPKQVRASRHGVGNKIDYLIVGSFFYLMSLVIAFLAPDTRIARFCSGGTLGGVISDTYANRKPLLSAGGKL